MATIDLGKLGFVNKGTYNNSTTYEKNDLVQFTDGGILSTYLYIDSTAQSGQAPSSSGTVGSRWVYFAKGVADAVASAGNNKVLVTDGSGSLSPLSIGLLDKFKSKSSANGFEFGTVLRWNIYSSCQTIDILMVVIKQWDQYQLEMQMTKKCVVINLVRTMVVLI